MNKTLSTILTVLAVLELAAVIFIAGSMYARVGAFGPGNLMAGYAWHNNTSGPNMMNGRGPNMMGGYMYNNANGTTLTIDQAKASTEQYLAALNNSDLQIAEVMIFDNNAYVVVKETSTGRGAFELLVDPVSQTAYPEHGPNMMWNLKYGSLNHQKMMGGFSGMMTTGGMTLAPGASAGVNGWDSTTPSDVSAEMNVTSEQAIQYAQKYLNGHVPGTTSASDPIPFYGYYALDFEKDGKIAGMLSVNGYTGQVFLHTWHGTFIEEAAVE
jgi:hypothetical protein